MRIVWVITSHHLRIPFWSRCLVSTPVSQLNQLRANGGPETRFLVLSDWWLQTQRDVARVQHHFFFSNYMHHSISRESRGLQYDMRKLAEAIVAPEATVELELVLGMRF
jgi:hypothetical protein